MFITGMFGIKFIDEVLLHSVSTFYRTNIPLQSDKRTEFGLRPSTYQRGATDANVPARLSAAPREYYKVLTRLCGVTIANFLRIYVTVHLKNTCICKHLVHMQTH